MKINTKQQIIPSSVFAEVACKHFKCNIADLDIRMITENKEAFVMYENYTYKVSTHQSLRDDIKLWLTDKNSAMYIHIGCWISATKNTVDIGIVIDELIKDITNVKQAKMILVALDLGSYAKNEYVAFWKTLTRIDNSHDLVSSAMVATARIYDGEGLIDDLTQVQVDNGLIVYNQFEGGIFETVLIDEPSKEYPAFYIYSADHAFEV